MMAGVEGRRDIGLDFGFGISDLKKIDPFSGEAQPSHLECFAWRNNHCLLSGTRRGRSFFACSTFAGPT